MKQATVLFLFILLCSFAYSQHRDLKKRVVKFHEIEEDQNLNDHDKAIKLKEYILPGIKNDSMAHFFSKNWNYLNSISKKLETRIVSIDINPDNIEATVTIEDILTYASGEKAVFISKTIWVKENTVWYRSYKKSQLYKNGVRVR